MDSSFRFWSIGLTDKTTGLIAIRIPDNKTVAVPGS